MRDEQSRIQQVLEQERNALSSLKVELEAAKADQAQQAVSIAVQRTEAEQMHRRAEEARSQVKEMRDALAKQVEKCEVAHLTSAVCLAIRMPRLRPAETL